MFSKNVLIVPSLGNGEICIIRYKILMVVHYASCFMQRIGKNGPGCNSIILIMCVLMLTRQNMCILHVFLMGNSPAYMLVPQQVAHRT